MGKQITKDGIELVQMAVMVQPDMRRRIKVAAAMEGKTMPEIVAEALERYLSTNK